MNIKNILSGLTLLGMGGVAGYFIAKKQLRDQYKEDLLDVQEFYYKKLQELGVMEEDFEPEEPTDEEVLEEFKRTSKPNDLWDIDEIHDYPNKIVEMPEKKDKNKAKTETSKDAGFDRSKGRPIINYNKPPLEQILATIEEDEVDDDSEYDEDEAYQAEIQARAEEFVQKRYENQLNGEPYCITYDEYQDALDKYDTQTLYYYLEDRVLCEDDDSIVDEEEELVGLDYEDVLSMQTIAWVKNDTLCMLYEIHRIDDSYTRVVTNAIETPREREFRLVARRKEALDQK